MIHENRGVRNHRGLAARQAQQAPPTKEVTTTTTSTRRGFHIPILTRIIPPTTPTSPVPPVVTPSESVVPSNSVPPTASTSVLPSSDTSSFIVSTSTTPSPTPIPPTTTSAPETTSSTITSSTSSTSSTHPKSSTTVAAAKSSGAVSTGALAGGIAGGIAGAVVLVILVFFLVRRYRRKSLETLAFNASQFRRSAYLLDDKLAPPEKQAQKQQQSRPRPPTMIERHMHSPAVPPTSAALPYGEHAVRSTDPYGQYAASAAQYNVGMYGADGQIMRDPHAELYGGNVSGAAYGQHAAYGQAAYGAPRNQYQQYPQRQQYPQQQYQSPFAPGQALPFTRTAAPTNNAMLPNPFANRLTPASAVLAAVRTAAHAGSHTPSAHSHSTSSSNDSGSANTSTPASQTTTTTATNTRANTSYLNRQPTQSGGAPPAYEPDAHYADVQRDVKFAPGALAVVNKDGAQSSAGAGAGTAAAANRRQRPLSSHTVYDPDDAYGGM